MPHSQRYPIPILSRINPILPLRAELYRKGVKMYFKTLEPLEQFELKSVHILLNAHKGNCRHNVALAPLGVEFYKEVKKYFKTLEGLEQFEQKHVRTLTTTHKGNCRHKVTLQPLGVEL